MEETTDINLCAYKKYLGELLLLRQESMEKYNYVCVDLNYQKKFDALVEKVKNYELALELTRERIVEIEEEVRNDLGIKSYALCIRITSC